MSSDLSDRQLILTPRPLRKLARELGEGVFSTSRFRDNLRLFVPPERLEELLETAQERSAGSISFRSWGRPTTWAIPAERGRGSRCTTCCEISRRSECLIVKAGVDDPDPALPSAVPLWPGADWMEREVFDMFGIRFIGHPDLRRILMPEEFTAYPLRKDYPLRGRGERHNFPRLSRGES